MYWAVTSRSSSSTALTRSSTSFITEGGTGAGFGKSKRSRPGEFSEPIWVAVSPRISRNALWIMWVAVCAREIARRRARSTSPIAPTPTSAWPSATVPRWTNSPGTGCWTS